MLDLNDPQAPHIVAASRQIDLILDYLKRISYSKRKERIFMLEVIRPACVALRWLNAHRFKNSEQIAGDIDELERQAERLARQGDGRLDLDLAEGGRVSKCPACRGPITSYGGHQLPSGATVPLEHWCSRCLDIVLPTLERLRSSDRGFGTG